MSTPEQRPPDGAPADPETAAAEWLARRDAGWSAADERDFAVWLAADACHSAAWHELEASWRVCDRPRRAGVADAMIAELAARRKRRRWRVYWSGATALAAAACGALLFVDRPAGPRPAEAAWTPGAVTRPETRTLPDGSTVELNQHAEITVEYSAARRGVRLVRGEAHFAVQKDPARPFVVAVGGIEVRAVGTAFAVKLDPVGVDVVVTEGRVTVECPPVAATATTPAALRAPVLVEQGGLLSVPATAAATSSELELRPRAMPTAEIERRLAWREARLELSGTPVAEVVALLNRGSSVHLRIGDADVAAMRMSGVFRADDAEGFARLLELHYGVAVERRSADELVLRRAR